MRKYYFPLHFIDQMLDKLAGHEYYCFLSGYSRYNRIYYCPKGSRENNVHLSLWHICLSKDAVWVMQCIGNISKMYDCNFLDMVKKSIEVFMDDFSMVGASFDSYR